MVKSQELSGFFTITTISQFIVSSRTRYRRIDIELSITTISQFILSSQTRTRIDIGFSITTISQFILSNTHQN